MVSMAHQYCAVFGTGTTQEVFRNSLQTEAEVEMLNVQNYLNELIFTVFKQPGVDGIRARGLSCLDLLLGHQIVGPSTVFIMTFHSSSDLPCVIMLQVLLQPFPVADLSLSYLPSKLSMFGP